MKDELKKALKARGMTVERFGALFGGVAVVQAWLDGTTPVPANYHSRINKILYTDFVVEAVQSAPIPPKEKKNKPARKTNPLRSN